MQSGIRWLDDAINEIDAGVFSSDTFHDAISFEVLQWYINRWQQGLYSISSVDDEEEKSGD